MAFLEIYRGGRLVRRQEVEAAQAAKGVRVRLGKEISLVQLSHPAKLGDWEAKIVNHPSSAGPSFAVDGAPNLPGYELQGQLGEGGMGVVWKGIQLSTKRPVAIKFLGSRSFASERSQRRFEREVELSAKLDHPNIAAIYDSGLQHGVQYFAMQLIDGAPLDAFVKERKLGHRQILELFKPVCLAVQHAHQRGVIHRDLKPANILVSADGQPHVLDFGLAKALLTDDEASSVDVSIEGEASGTPAYMSPEQAAGRHAALDTRTDIYSLGVTLYRLLTGQSPHDLSGTRYQVTRRIVEQEAKPARQSNPALDREVEALLRKTLEHRPEDRYASAAELAADIDNYLQGEPLAARPATTAYFLIKRLKKNRLPVAAAALMLLTLVASAGISYFRIVVERSHALAAAAREREAREALQSDEQQLIEAKSVAETERASAVAAAEKERAAREALQAKEEQLVAAKNGADAARKRADQEAASALAAAEEQRELREALEAKDQQLTDAKNVSHQEEGQAADAAKAAQASQLIAARQTAAARRAADLTQARYLIAQADLPGAMVCLSEADKLGMSFEDRLALDELYSAARPGWRLIARAPLPDRPEMGCCSTTDTGERVPICFANGELMFLSSSGNKAPTGVPVSFQPDELLPIRSGIVARSGSALHPFALVPIPHELAEVDDRSSIISACSNLTKVAVLREDRRLQVFDGSSFLAGKSVISFELVLPPTVPVYPGTRIWLSPDGKDILVHSGAWNKPTWLANCDGGIGTIDVRAGEMAFAQNDSTRFYSWFAPSGTGGLPDECNGYSTLAPAQSSPPAHFTVPSQDTKERLALRISGDGRLTFLGALGLLTVREEGRSDRTAVRYRSLWPFADDDPRFLAADQEGNEIVLAAGKQALAFLRDSTEEADLHQNVDDYSWCVAPGGTVRIQHKQVVFAPFGRGGPGAARMPLQWLVSTPTDAWYCWGITVSADGQTAAILAQETNGSNTVSSAYGRKVAVIYDTSKGLTDPASWRIHHQIDLPELKGVAGLENRLIRLSPDGKTLTAAVVHGLAVSYDVTSGTRKGLWAMSGESTMSQDGRFLAGIIAGAQLAVVDVGTATILSELAGVNGVMGTCFSDDDRLLIVNRAWQRLEAYDLRTGKLAWSRASTLASCAWPSNQTRFAGLLSEGEGSGGALVLAMQTPPSTTAPAAADSAAAAGDADKSPETLAVISHTGDSRNEVAFSPDGKEICFQASRWEARSVRAMDYAELVDALKTPEWAATAVVAQPPAPVAPVVPSVPSPLRGIIDAQNDAEILEALGKDVVVVGRVNSVWYTHDVRGVNVDFTGATEHSLVMWVPANVFASSRDLFPGPSSQALVGAKLRVHGHLALWKGRAQITPGSRDDIQLLDRTASPSATSGPSVISAADSAAVTASLGAVSIVEGTIVSANWRTNNKLMLAEFAGTDSDGVKLVVFANARDSMNQAFGGNIVKALRGAKVRITGKLQLYEGRPEIALEKPQDLVILTAGSPAGPASAPSNQGPGH